MRFKVVSIACLLMLSTATLAQVVYLDNQPVGSLAEKMNRINHKKIRFADHVAAQKIVNGRFRLDQPDSLVRGLKDIYPDLQIIETKDGWIVKTTPAPKGLGHTSGDKPCS